MRCIRVRKVLGLNLVTYSTYEGIDVFDLVTDNTIADFGDVGIIVFVDCED